MMDVGKWFEEMLGVDGDEIELSVDRVRVQPGRSFSAEALDELHAQMIAFVGTRLMRRWNATNEPPSSVRVEMRVTVG